MSGEYPHISLPVPQMKPHYDVVVIGSGYGGGIAASRMSRAGKRVALLERGKERWPGEYPNTEKECIEEVQYSSARAHLGKRTGMYHYYNSQDQNAVVACGLGGTSLINANVALEADDRVWQMPVWPDEISNDRDSIKRGYERAKEMLQPCQYPTHFPELPKLKTLENQAKFLGEDYHKNFYRTPITVTFENRVNAAGVRQRASTLTGNDATGINDGSKNSTLMNYIPDAWNHGCEVFCECDVKRIKKCEKSGKYIVFYEWLDDDRTNFVDDSRYSLFFVTADVVFLAAGTLGSNEILLRSKSHGLKVSDCLGRGFSGNGDILGIGYNTDCFVNCVGPANDDTTNMKVPVGPCITGVIDMRHDADNVLDGYVIEEGSIPGSLGSFFRRALDIGESLIGIEPTNLTYAETLRRKWREVQSLIGGVYTGATANTQTYLIMSHDNNTGQLELVNDRLKIEYKGVGASDTIIRLNKVLEEATMKVNGTYIPSPLWSKLLGSELVTVHPIGGCNMGKDGKHGVVNHKGQVFTDDDENVHEGLYVCDGSIVPIALGVNPFLTISALAERICEYAAEDRDWSINYELVTKPIDFDRPLVSYEQNESDLIRQGRNLEGGVHFTEVMRGYFSTEVLSEDYAAAELQARSSDSTMQFLLTIIAYNVQTLVNMDDHSALITGTVSCRALSPDPLLVTRGNFRLFIEDNDRVDSNRMMYDLILTATDGAKYRFEGYKLVGNGTAISQWEETTTLMTTVYLLDGFNEGDANQEERGKVVGRGILHIKPSDLLKQLTTLRGTGSTAASRARALITFDNFFATTVLKHIFVRFLPLEYPKPFPITNSFYYKDRPKKEEWEIIAEDGVKSMLTRYKGGRKGPVLLVHGASVSHEMWSTNLIKNSFLDYLLEHEYDVFLNDNRVSSANPACNDQHTLDDIRLDQAAAVNKVREITGVEKIGMVVHCLGSVVTFMGLLDGKVQGVGSLVTSQVAMHPIAGFWNYIKLYSRFLPFMRYVLHQSSFDVRTSPDSDLFNKILNQLLRFYPVPRNQACRNALCHRISFIYGTLYQHENLNQEIHDYQDEFFGLVNLTTMQHLSDVSQKKLIVNHSGQDVYATQENIRNRLNFPICFIHGDKNVIYDTDGMKKSFDAVRLVNGADHYVYHELDGYGHMDTWWGTNAVEDVFPKALSHLEETKHLWGYGAQYSRRGLRPFSDPFSDDSFSSK